MDTKLGNKVGAVTGGSAVTGLGAAKRFAAAGAQVFITGRRQSELDVATIAGNVTAIQGSVSKLFDIDRICKTVKEQAGRIDILFVNAGFYEVRKLGVKTEEHFDKTFNTNARGLLFAEQNALPLLSRATWPKPQCFSLLMKAATSMVLNPLQMERSRSTKSLWLARTSAQHEKRVTGHSGRRNGLLQKRAH